MLLFLFLEISVENPTNMHTFDKLKKGAGGRRWHFLAPATKEFKDMFQVMDPLMDDDPYLLHQALLTDNFIYGH